MRKNSQKGSITVESSLIIPIVIFCILAVLYFLILLYQQAYSLSVSDNAAERGAAVWNNSHKDIDTGRLGINDIGKDGLYWRLFDGKSSLKQAKITNYIGKPGQSTSLLNKRSILSNTFQEGKINLSNYIIYKSINVSINKNNNIPVSGVTGGFGIINGYNTSSSSVQSINEPAELIRNLDFAADIENELERKHPGFANLVQKAGDIITTIKDKINEFFN